MEGLDPENMQDLRKVALKLQEQFGCGESEGSRKPVENNAEHDRLESLSKVVNAPVDFELKDLDREHPYLLDCGFTRETVQHFGVGFCSRGLMKNRVVIPLHDAAGNLVGYAGRVIDDKSITDDNPRYRFPSGREKGDIYYDFRKSLFLYNGFAVAEAGKLKEVKVVESFTACFWLHQNGFEDVVALMEASCSPEQAALIVAMTHPYAVVTILSDGDDAGVRCAISVFTEVAPYRKVRWAKLEPGKQPTDYDQAALKRLWTYR
jgi:DNA primase